MNVQRSSSPLRTLATGAENLQQAQAVRAVAAPVLSAVSSEQTPPARGFLGTLASRLVRPFGSSQPASSASDAAAGSSAVVVPPHPRDQRLAEQARIYIPVAEVISRQIAYDEADYLDREWTLTAPSFHARACENWRTMYAEGSRQLSRVLVDAFTESAREDEYVLTGAPREATPIEVASRGRWVKGKCPDIMSDYFAYSRDTDAAASAASAAAPHPDPADEWVVVDQNVVEEDIDCTHASESAAASSAPRRDESFRMIWGRIVQHPDLNPHSARETSCFIGFRGTYNGDGWAADFYTPSDGGLHPGEVRFHQLVESKKLFENPLRHALREAQRTGKKARILITGHSLGGSDCERYAALFCHMVAQISEQDPTLRDHLAGITVIPFNSPGTHPIYGELFQAASDKLEAAGIQVACVDMKQHGDTVQKASSSRISLGAPACSAIVKMRNARAGLWHIDPMTIRGEGRKFSVIEDPLNGERSPLAHAKGSQICPEGRIYYRVLNRLKGAVPKIARLILDRKELITTPGYQSDEAIREQARTTADQLALRWTRTELAQAVAARILPAAIDRELARGLV